MSQLSIFEPAWLDLVFEGKNKEYGAYQLRRENSRTTIKALFIALLLVTAAISIPYLTSVLSTTVIAPISQPVVTHIELTHIITPPKPEPPKKATNVLPLAPKSEAPKAKPTMANAVVAKKEDATPDVPENKDIPTVSSPTGTGVVSGTTNGNGPNTASAGTTTLGEGDDPAGTNIYKSVDKLPQYPGGIEKFYQYVGKNFRSPEDEQASGSVIRVVVSFVIEKDGSMTDIKVIQNPGYGMDREAIRVLKSLKIKWEPGKVKGNPVRTAYSLPISVKAQ